MYRFGVSSRLVCVLAVIGAMLGACTPGGASQPAPDTIKIGAVVPLTGRYASLGEQIRSGYELAIEDINRTGGVMINAYGRRIPIELKMIDDESDPTKTVQRMETLYSSEGIWAYLGGVGSDLHAAAAPIADKNKTPYLGVGFALNSIHQKGLKYLFSPFPKSPAIAKMTIDMMDTLNPKPNRIAIFAEKTDWGAEMRDLWKKEAQARGYQVVADEEYAVGAQDFSPMILAAKNGSADAALALPSPPDGLAIAKQMKELDFNAKFYLFVRAADSPPWSNNLGKDGDYFMFSPGWSPDLKFPGVDQLKQAHQAKYNKPADAVTGSAYAAVQILANSIERAGRLDRDAIRDAVSKTDMTTVAGPVKFNADGTAQIITLTNQWQNGKQVLVWPRDQASAPIAYPAPDWRSR